MSIRQGTFDELPGRIKPTDLVLDVGGGIKPLSRANYVLDFLPWRAALTREPWLLDTWPKPYFSQETWIQWDLCSRQPWPFKDKQFDFVLCKGTLEDLRDPIGVCEEMVRVAKAGYFETPTRVLESMPGVERVRYCGHSHHHWYVETSETGVEFTFKHAMVHGYSRFHPTVGPDWSTGRRAHGKGEILDPLQGFFFVINRWFRELNPRHRTLGVFWTDSFTARERVLVDKADVEADLMNFKARAAAIEDLWTPKRTWYGRKRH